jgi:methyl-accepting chemotaxis protein
MMFPGDDKLRSETLEAENEIEASEELPARRAEKVDPLTAMRREVEEYRNFLELVSHVATDAAAGDLEARLIHIDDSDRFAKVARAVNHLLDMTDAFLREAGAALEHASQGHFYRRVLLQGMRGTFRHKSQLINDATETLGRNTYSMKQVEQEITVSAEMSQTAKREAAEASAVVAELGKSSARISEVLKSISQIAWQTKLLALNAKIEASHAGAAGRGFAIVAQEVNHLAQQTEADAAKISREIAEMRKQVQSTTTVIETVKTTIEKMQEIASKIESAVAKQREGTASR